MTVKKVIKDYRGATDLLPEVFPSHEVVSSRWASTAFLWRAKKEVECTDLHRVKQEFQHQGREADMDTHL